MTTIDETNLNLLRMSRAYIGLANVQDENLAQAKKLLDKALSAIDPKASFRAQIPNAFQDPTPEPTPAATWDSEPMGG